MRVHTQAQTLLCSATPHARTHARTRLARRILAAHVCSTFLRHAHTTRAVSAQAKVEEIQKILDEDITPTLEKLRKERAAYIAWSSGNVEKERLERFCTAWDFTQAEETTKASTSQANEMEEEMQGMENKIAELEAEKKSKQA